MRCVMRSPAVESHNSFSSGELLFFFSVFMVAWTHQLKPPECSGRHRATEEQASERPHLRDVGLRLH